MHRWEDVYSVATGHIKYFNIHLEYNEDPIEMLSENKQLKILTSCLSVIKRYGSSAPLMKLHRFLAP